VVVAAAANETSAKLVFTPAKTMVDLSHGALEANLLEDLCDAWDSQIFLRGQANAEMRKVPASPKATEGLNIFVNLMDEWHEWTHPAATQTATKLQNGTALRPDYMNLRTTTAGHDLESLCGEDYEFGKAVAAGEVDAPEWFFRWYEAPREVERDGKIVALDWRSEEAVALSNPSYGALAQWPFYANKLRREKESIYRRYFLNQWTETEEAWLPTGAWEGCEAAHLEPEAGWPTAIGWDAATKHDSTAVVLAQKREVRDGETDATVSRIVLRAWIWERPFDPETRKPVEDWLLPIEEVKAQLAELLAAYAPTSIEYDPTFITWEAASLAAIGWPMREFSQSSVQKLAQASQGFYERVIEGIVAHNGEARFSRHIKSAAARQTSSGSAAWLLAKGKAKRKMDAAVESCMAIWGLEHPPEGKGPKRVSLEFA
jgi:phage terminase large subunit-like protein